MDHLGQWLTREDPEMVTEEQRLNQEDALADLDAGTDTGEDWELVDEEWECPNCHERRMDWLIPSEDGDTATCQACGFVYNL